MWINTGILSRAAVSQIGSSSGSSMCSACPSAFVARRPKSFHDLAQAQRAFLHIRFQLLRHPLAEARPTSGS